MKLLDNLNNYDKIALLIRHSDRDKIPEGEFGNEILLNEKGIQHAIEYGKHLQKFQLNKIFTSPIPRCIQTAEKIIQGYGQDIKILTTAILGDPGVHVKDANKVGDYYLKNGFWKMYENYKKGIKIEGLPTFEELTNSLNKFLIDKTEQKGITIFITHDSLIAFYAYASGISEYTERNWVNYLDGLKLKID